MFDPKKMPPPKRKNDSTFLEPDQSMRVIIDLARDFWRLKNSLKDFTNSNGDLPRIVETHLERINEDLAIAQIEVFEVTGQAHIPGNKYNISHVEDGDGQFIVTETRVPGVRVKGRLVSPPTVVLGHGEIADKN